MQRIVRGSLPSIHEHKIKEFFSNTVTDRLELELFLLPTTNNLVNARSLSGPAFTYKAAKKLTELCQEISAFSGFCISDQSRLQKFKSMRNSVAQLFSMASPVIFRLLFRPSFFSSSTLKISGL